MTVEEKANLVLKLVEEIVDEVIDEENNVGGFMRTFGKDYKMRMKTFANIFKGYDNKPKIERGK